MKLVFTFISLLLPLSALGAEKILTLKYYVDKDYVSVPTRRIGKVRVNDMCYRKVSTCKALKVSKTSPKSARQKKNTLAGNPGANYCWDLGAKNRILKDDQNNQYDFCVFEDGSMVDAWNLYEAHYPAAIIK